MVDWFRLFTVNELLTEPSVYLDAGKKVFSKHFTQKRGDAEIEANGGVKGFSGHMTEK